ncbi:DUF4445 domain-containing protein [Peptacetobacter hominis]|uniref:DUF4445 domain-containing protein n=1 Tax=Peptacetobacter hominis TaxID=2743610 RepID=A0A544QW55_9FIRM|nr:ASKHA domain-containing protein [Peptacetobacter hominis]TQQ84916.1 DUF4445 domain-containing protein [Peptacetobacter hominis]
MSFIKISDGSIIEYSDGKRLMDVLLENGVFVENPCNGNGTCGKCKVKIISGNTDEITDAEKSILKKEEIEKGIRLSCLLNAYGDYEIENNSGHKNYKVLSSGYIPEFEIDSDKDGYGIIVDIGTTTVAMGIINLANGNEIGKMTKINPQRKYGSDVLTRITYEYENPDNGVEIMQKSIVECINELIDEICSNTDMEKEKIKEILISANCTMTHMLLGEDAKSLGKYPYEPVFKNAIRKKASAIGIMPGYNTDLYCIAQVSAFIGGDIVSGVYACELEKRKGNILFIDIGTNGEIVLSIDGKMACCSCAAGPALEGMNISCGMSAADGAIEDIKITEEGIKLKVIGDKKPLGICGSGILSAIEQMIKHGIIDKRGTFIKKESIAEDDYRYSMIKLNGNKREFIISKDPEITITQSDVRQVQLAKGAILSGFKALLKEENIDMKELDKVLIAGQFGSHLTVESLTGTGILPFEVSDKIEYIGNTSKSGAYMALMSEKAKDDMEKLGKEMNYVELAVVDGYDKIFRDSMKFPVV